MIKRRSGADPEGAVYDVAERIAARARAGAVQAAAATGCSSSARTCSRSSRSSCAAPTTRWRRCRARGCSKGVIAASAGNHAQGVALAAQKLGCRAVIVMPVTTPRIKIDAVAARGARSCCTATPIPTLQEGAAIEEGARPDVRASLRRPGVSSPGQGTIGMEILRQHPRADRRDLRAGGRRRPDLGHRRLRQARAIRRSGSSASSRWTRTRWRGR